MATKNPLTIHVLDTALGLPVQNLPVTVYIEENNGWTPLGQGTTNSDGRCPGLLTRKELKTGVYKMKFDTGCYLSQTGQYTGTLPYVEIFFEVEEPEQHYHIPLLRPTGYTTYRGS